MVASPPLDCLIGRQLGGGEQRRMMTRSSPKTPIHPSNGYAMMDDEDDGLRPPASSVKMSPGGRTRSGRAHDVQLEGIPSNDLHNVSFEDQPTNHSPTKDCEEDEVTVVVSQEEENGFVVVSQEEAPASLDNPDFASATSENQGDDTPSKSKSRRSRRKSTASNNTSKSTRRRSLRLREKVLPLTPEKKVSTADEKARKGAIGESNHATDELETTMDLDMMEDDNNVASSKPSSRRRSLRVQARMLESPSPPAVVTTVAAANTKSQTKRRYSAVVRGTKKKDVDASSLPPSSKKKKRSVAEIHMQSSTDAQQDEDDDDVKLPSPKKLCLEEKNEMPSSMSKSACFDGINQNGQVTLPPKKLCLEEKNAFPASKSASFDVGISQNGEVKLSEALEKIAFDVVIGPSSFNNVSKRRKSTGRSMKKKRCQLIHQKSMLESLDDAASQASALSSTFSNENGLPILNSSAKKPRPKNRRDTFDLSKKRGLTSTAKRIEELNILIDEEVVSNEGANPDYVTPKAGSTGVNINAIVNEISRTMDDEPKEGNSHHHGSKEESVNECTEEESAVKANLQNLTSIAIEEQMRELFPDQWRQVYNYPCVSARIFAAMSIVYEDQANFTPLLPFLLSLVNAEIVSLKNTEEHEVCFINKKVCFSGFDYSSTTTTVGAVVGQGGGDLRPGIEALEAVLQQALKLPRPIHYLDVAIQCLMCMAPCAEASDVCSKTMVGYFPSARFTKASKHYVNELKDVKRFVLSQSNAQAGDNHIGVRYRLNDFIGRSVRYHLRELLNTIPDHVVDFDVDECEERWGRAVDDRSISSILNFSLEKIHELITLQPKIFEYGVQSMPDFFARQASTDVYSLSRDTLKQMDKSTYEDLVQDITEARSFLFGARACKFVLELLLCPGVEEHIDACGGWVPVEAITSTFYKLNLFEDSENQHFIQLREVRDLIFMLEDVDGRFEQTIEHCEFCIRRMRRKVNFKTKSNFIHNLKVHLAGEKGEYFPLVVT